MEELTVGAISDLFEDKFLAERPVLQLLCYQPCSSNQKVVYRLRLSDSIKSSDRFLLFQDESANQIRPNQLVKFGLFRLTRFKLTTIRGVKAVSILDMSLLDSDDTRRPMLGSPTDLFTNNSLIANPEPETINYVPAQSIQDQTCKENTYRQINMANEWKFAGKVVEKSGVSFFSRRSGMGKIAHVILAQESANQVGRIKLVMFDEQVDDFLKVFEIDQNYSVTNVIETGKKGTISVYPEYKLTSKSTVNSIVTLPSVVKKRQLDLPNENTPHVDCDSLHTNSKKKKNEEQIVQNKIEEQVFNSINPKTIKNVTEISKVINTAVNNLKKEEVVNQKTKRFNIEGTYIGNGREDDCLESN